MHCRANKLRSYWDQTLHVLSQPFFFVMLIAGVFVVLRVPTLFEGIWDRDEGVYEVIGFALRHNLLLYRDIWDNKPPLLYLIYALCDGNILPVKWLSLCFGVVGLLLLYLLAKQLGMSRPGMIIALVFFTGLFATPLYSGNVANAEDFMVPIIIGAYLAFAHALHMDVLQKQRRAYLLLCVCGLLLGIAALVKLVAIFDLGALVCFLSCYQGDSFAKVIRRFPRTLLLCGCFILPLVATWLFFITQHAGSIFITSVFLTNVSYVGDQSRLIVPYGYIYGVLLNLVFVCVILWLLRTYIASNVLLVALWLFFSVFNALFSNYNWSHYGLVFAASGSLFAGMALARWRAQKILLLFLLGACYFVHSIPFQASYTLAYYQRYYLFATGKVSTFDYRPPVMADYDVVSYLQKNSERTEGVLIWSNYAQPYRMLDRLPPGSCVVAFQEELLHGVQKHVCTIANRAPTLVVILPQTGSFPYSLAGYKLIQLVDGARIYRLSAGR